MHVGILPGNFNNCSIAYFIAVQVPSDFAVFRQQWTSSCEDYAIATALAKATAKKLQALEG